MNSVSIVQKLSLKPFPLQSFADVPIHPDGIDTHAFLEASEGLVGMFDLLGTGIFGFVQADIRSNIKVRQIMAGGTHSDNIRVGCTGSIRICRPNTADGRTDAARFALNMSRTPPGP